MAKENSMKTNNVEKTKKQNEECLHTQEDRPLKVMEVRHFIEVDDEVYEVLDPAEHKIKKNSMGIMCTFVLVN